MSTSFPDIRTAARLLGGDIDKRGQINCPGPGHSAKDRSLSVRPDPTAPSGYIVNSFAGDDPLACKDFVADKLGLERWKPPETAEDIIARMTEQARRSRSNGNGGTASEKPKVVAEYVYRLADGTPYLKVLRTDPKGFPQRHWTGSGWATGKPNGPKVPYRLPEMLEAIGDEVFIVEGEKDADALAALGFVATSASEGAGCWTADLDTWFKGRIVHILADNDKAGRDHAYAVAEHLHGVAAEVRIVSLPGLPEKGDVSDWLAVEGNDRDKLLSLVADVPLWTPAETDTGISSSVPAEPKQRFPLLPFSDLTPGTSPAYLVKGLLPRVGLAAIWGPPKCGKSFWFFDLLCHVALGWAYRGKRVEDGAVVYCAFEGAEGYKARAEAFRRKYKLAGGHHVPLFLMPVRVDLVRDHQALIAAIREQLGNIKPVAVGLDTLNRSLAGSESSDEDMSAYINAGDAIREAFACLVGIVHHCGVNEGRPRGHTSLTGAVDAQLAVKRDGVGTITVTVERMKDGPEGEVLTGRLETVEVGTDDEGDPITSCVVVPAEGEATGSDDDPKLSKNQRTMFSILHDAGRKGLSTDEWNKLAREAGLGLSRRADLHDFRSVLRAKDLVRQYGERWTVAQL